MGRRKKMAPRRRNNKQDEFRTDLITKSEMNNERLFSYYKAQNAIPEEEWDDFLEALRRSLPTTFRVAGSPQTLKNIIESVHVPNLNDVTYEEERIPPPEKVAWYPDGLAWQFNVPKKVLRKSPEFKKFHSFLVYETEVGNISRQEGVSMLPPLFLDVEPHHRVIDMCAAPGSKTAQLLEALHAQDTVTSASIPPGLLLANDSDFKRTHLLIHQSARLPSPALMVTNLDASIYPIIKIPSTTHPNRTETLLFDRILCDVPCSGDGTIRKNPGIWHRWAPGDGNGLHSLQVRILQRAMKMLKDTGRIVYSTCSLNPVENEAVIAEALQSTVGQGFYLVDVKDKLPELIRRPGLTSWRATSDRSAQQTFATYEEFMKSQLDDAQKTKLTEGHFAPKDPHSLNLERCIRIYPHLQDTGGFFVAVLERTPKARGSQQSREKKREAAEQDGAPDAKKPRLETQSNEPAETNTPVGESALEGVAEESSTQQAKETGSDGTFKENPYTFLQPDDAILETCMNRLHLTSQFPAKNILVRTPPGESIRSLYLANDTIRAIIENNDYTRIRLTSAGTKVLTKQEAGRGAEAQYRVLAEALPVVLPYIDPKTILAGDFKSLKTLIESYYPLCESFESPFKESVEALVSGGHIVRFPTGAADGVTLAHDLLLPIWKSNVSLTLMVDKKAKSALSLRLYGQDLTTSGQAKGKGRQEIPEEESAEGEVDEMLE